MAHFCEFTGEKGQKKRSREYGKTCIKGTEASVHGAHVQTTRLTAKIRMSQCKKLNEYISFTLFAGIFPFYKQPGCRFCPLMSQKDIFLAF